MDQFSQKENDVIASWGSNWKESDFFKQYRNGHLSEATSHKSN